MSRYLAEHFVAEFNRDVNTLVNDICSYTTSSDSEEVDDGNGGTTTQSVLYVNVILKSYQDKISSFE